MAHHADRASEGSITSVDVEHQTSQTVISSQKPLIHSLDAVMDLQSLLQESPALCTAKTLVFMTVREKGQKINFLEDCGNVEDAKNGSYQVVGENFVEPFEVIQQLPQPLPSENNCAETIQKYNKAENDVSAVEVCPGSSNIENVEEIEVEEYVILEEDVGSCSLTEAGLVVDTAQDIYVENVDLLASHEVIIETTEDGHSGETRSCAAPASANTSHSISYNIIDPEELVHAEQSGKSLTVISAGSNSQKLTSVGNSSTFPSEEESISNTKCEFTFPQESVAEYALTMKPGDCDDQTSLLKSEPMTDTDRSVLPLEACQPDVHGQIDIASEIEISYSTQTVCPGSSQNSMDKIEVEETTAGLDPESGILSTEIKVEDVAMATDSTSLKSQQKLRNIINRVTRSISAKQLLHKNGDIRIGQVQDRALLSYPCTVCSKLLSIKKLAKHVKIHKDLPATCPCCFMSFDDVTELAKHLLSIHGNKQGLRCTVCDEEFKRAEHLKVHMASHTGEPLYKCSICMAEFNKSHIFYSHLGSHTDADAPFTCNVCQRLFQELSRYKAHLRVHDGSTYVKCLRCAKTFFNKTALRDHKMRCHGKQQALSCDECDKQFGNALSLQKHKLRHTRENANKRYVCIFCSRTFLDSGSYTRHERLHTEERPFLCSLCGQQFITMGYLNQHLRQKHTTKEQTCEKQLPPVVKKEHVCEICHKSFAAENSLKTHQRQHTGETPYECTICGKKYKQSSNLRDHELLHSGERPFACTLCPKKFTRSGNLTAHMQRVHEGVKKYQCPVCGKPYSQSRSVVSHMAKSHANVAFDRSSIVPVNVKVNKKGS